VRRRDRQQVVLAPLHRTHCAGAQAEQQLVRHGPHAVLVLGLLHLHRGAELLTAAALLHQR
jgi:hypothetical protein